MVWVIGCNGMLGTELCRQLKQKGIQFEGTDRNVDITQRDSLNQFAHGKKIDFIVNCAAYTAVDKAEEDTETAEKLNCTGAKNIAETAKLIGAKLIHISTDYVFDGKGGKDSSGNIVPYTEDMEIAPLGVYGKTKADGEAAVSSVLKEFYILRTAWLYGWAGKNFVYTMIKAFNSRPAVKVVMDQRGTPTFCGTLASVIIKIIESCKNNKPLPFGIYHVTDLGETSWFEFAGEIKKQAEEIGLLEKNDCAVNSCTTEEYPTPAKRPAYSVLSKEKIQREAEIILPQWQDTLREFLTSKEFDRLRVL